MNLKEALEKRLLLRSESNKEKVEQSIKVAEEKLEEAKKSLEADI